MQRWIFIAATGLLFAIGGCREEEENDTPALAQANNYVFYYRGFDAPDLGSFAAGQLYQGTLEGTVDAVDQWIIRPLGDDGDVRFGVELGGTPSPCVVVRLSKCAPVGELDWNECNNITHVVPDTTVCGPSWNHPMNITVKKNQLLKLRIRHTLVVKDKPYVASFVNL